MTGSNKKDQPYGGKLRGVAALLGMDALEEAPAATPEETTEPGTTQELGTSNQGLTVAIAAIHLPAEQPRRYFDPEKLQQLADSIQHHGILEPLLVRPLGPGRYELVAGERRLRAAQSLQMDQVPVVVREMSGEEAIAIALIENLQREDLNPVEETEGVLNLLALHLGMKVDGIPALLYRMRNAAIGNSNQNVLISPEAETIQGVFSALGLLSWESFTTSRLPLLKLPPEILEALRSGQIAYTKAQTIARIKDPEQRGHLLHHAVALHWTLAQIKAAIAALPSATPAPQEPNLQQRADQAYRQIRRSPIWSDPNKKKQVEKLVNLLETLMAET
ncbi:ParB/RepB/Spo0J family partition protein [Prochlorothrix hollandica]|uniref:ParB/RepB/Spo0J family partition protein n=1 Tax=Prochlorothrix hollandica TaxID=1223 RepID=UPI0033424ED7